MKTLKNCSQYCVVRMIGRYGITQGGSCQAPAGLGNLVVFAKLGPRRRSAFLHQKCHSTKAFLNSKLTAHRQYDVQRVPSTRSQVALISFWFHASFIGIHWENMLRSTYTPPPPLPPGWTEHKAPTGMYCNINIPDYHLVELALTKKCRSYILL